MAKRKNAETEGTAEAAVLEKTGTGTLDEYIEKIIMQKADKIFGQMRESAQKAEKLVAKAEEDAIRNQKTLEENLSRTARTAVTNAGAASQKEAEDYYNRTLKEYEKARAAVRETLAEVDAKKKEIQELIILNSHMDESGCTTMDGTGKCYVYLSKEFIAAAGGRPYQVFLQEEAVGKLYVSKKMDSAFIVEGTAGIPFSYNVRVSVL